MNENTYSEDQVLVALTSLSCLLTCPGRARLYDPYTGTICDEDGGIYFKALFDGIMCESCRRSHYSDDSDVLD